MTHSNAPPSQNSRVFGGNRWLALGFLVIGVPTALVIQGKQKGGCLTYSEVGDLQELEFVQTALRPLDACKIEYGQRDRRGVRRFPESIFLKTCSKGSQDSLVIRVGPEWAGRDIGFTMTRAAQAERWEVIVESDEVPFPDLLAALQAFTPKIAAEFPDLLREERASMDAYDAGLAEQKRAAQERRDAARGSYPTR